MCGLLAGEHQLGPLAHLGGGRPGTVEAVVASVAGGPRSQSGQGRPTGLDFSKGQDEPPTHGSPCSRRQ